MIHAGFEHTKIDGHKKFMLPVWFAMCLCSFQKILFVEYRRFLYNKNKASALKIIRLQQNENYVTTRPSRPICRAWTAPLSAV